MIYKKGDIVVVTKDTKMKTGWVDEMDEWDDKLAKVVFISHIGKNNDLRYPVIALEPIDWEPKKRKGWWFTPKALRKATEEDLVLQRL